MHISERAVGDVMIVDVSGKITLGDGGDVILKDKMQSLMQQGKKKVVLHQALHLVLQDHVAAVTQCDLARYVHDHHVADRSFRDMHDVSPLV